MKKELIEREMTQQELCAKVSELTGLKIDEAYLSNVISGRRNSDRVTLAIEDILWPTVSYAEDETTDDALQEIRMP